MSRTVVLALSSVSLIVLAHAAYAAELPTPAAVQSTAAPAAAGGAVTGLAVTGRDKSPLTGVLVRIRENGRTATTAGDGSYSFAGLAPGAYTLVLTTPSGQQLEKPVTVTDGGTARADFAADIASTALDEVVVMAQRTPVVVARLAQKEAPNLIVIQTYQEIRKLPDISAAEAVRRVPGISLESDEGEGRYVNIRGLDADLNSTTFGGLRLPPTNNASPFGGYRAVTLDSIPIGLVGALTVTKSNLPEQDAEALGGTIEITPKTAPAGGQPFLQGNVGTGYEPLRGTAITDLGITTGGHFGGPDGFFSNGPFSIVLTATYNEDSRGFDDVEPAYFNDSAHPYTAVNNIDQRDYELNRKRHGFGADLRYEPDANNGWYIRAFEAGYTERYKRPHLSISPDGNTVVLPNGQIQDTLQANDGAGNSTAITKQFRDEDETSIDRVFVAGGKNVFGPNTIDYRVGYTEGTYHKPYDVNSTFSLDAASAANAVITYGNSGPGHVPVYTVTGAPNYLDPTHYTLTGLSNSTADNFDKEYSFAGDYQRLADLFGSTDGGFKFGFDIRLRHKRTTAQPYSYLNLPTNITLASVASSGPETYYNGIYQNGVDIAPGYLQSQLGYGTVQPNGPNTPGDMIGAEQQYLDVHEDIYAGYGEYQATWGRFGFIAGVRVESTNDNSSAFLTKTTAPDMNGNTFTTAAPVSAHASYTNAFPSVQLRYELQPDLIARATYSSTIARPGFNQSNVSLGIDLGSNIETQGNPNLKPATANSFDISLEKYLPDGGIISAVAFYKLIDKYIVANEVIGGGIGGLNLFTYSNASSSYARGVELNFDDRFRFLPGLFSGLGISANFTYVDSRFEIRPGEFSPLPSTSKFTYNAGVFYEKGPITLRLSAYSTSADLFGIGTDKTSDVFNATRTSMDFGGSYAFRDHWVLYFAAKNLLNTPHAFYQGTPDRPIQREFYDQTYTLGVRFDY